MENPNKLLWRCRRGTKELDMLTRKFLDTHYINAGPELKRAFESMLEMQDTELYALLTGNQTSHDHNINKVIRIIQD